MKRKYSSPAIKVIKLELTSFMTNSFYWNPTGKKEGKKDGYNEDPDDPIDDDQIE